jgi:DNA modification methylase
MGNICSLLQGDSLEVLKTLASASVHCAITSPPYFQQRDYGAAGQIGLERTTDAYIANLVAVFREVRRVLRDDGSLWLNLGDTYGDGGRGPVKKKDLHGIPWAVAFALRADGWFLRSEIIWEKTNCLPESIKDRPTRSHETLFLLTKNMRYYYDGASIREPIQQSTLTRYRSGPQTGPKATAYGDPRVSRIKSHCALTPEQLRARGRNKRTVWRTATSQYRGAHFATYPPALIEPCILAGSPPGGVILDPFSGTATTGEVALRHGRKYVGIELNEEYMELARKRLGIA